MDGLEERQDHDSDKDSNINQDWMEGEGKGKRGIVCVCVRVCASSILKTTMKVALARVQRTQLSRRALTEVSLLQAPHSIPVTEGREEEEKIKQHCMQYEASNCLLHFSTALHIHCTPSPLPPVAPP